ncbi:MAG: hypothetical protein Ct9H300mP11_18760 [Chloroflexota bacterium]|nr:MAG: hypothetical protein Ct9H300mP11_18760 [Chloroflexota bacterium]
MPELVDWARSDERGSRLRGVGQNELDIIESTRELVLSKGEEITGEVYTFF